MIPTYLCFRWKFIDWLAPRIPFGGFGSSCDLTPKQTKSSPRNPSRLGRWSIAGFLWRAWGLGYKVWYTKNSLDGINNQLIERFNLGPTIGIAFKPFEVGKFKLRCRYDINASLLGELKENTNFDYLRQRITLSVVLGKQHWFAGSKMGKGCK